MKELAIAVVFVALLVLPPFVLGWTFGQRCEAAGFEGAAHERCVGRLVKGGPVYETF